MCTAVSYFACNHYFGRNLDLEYGYREQITITPRNFPLSFRHLPMSSSHFAMIGMATIMDGYPLYYEATNESGLSAAGLNFPNLAYYGKPLPNKRNLAAFEFIPWLLSQFQSVAEVKSVLPLLNLVDTPFSKALQPTPLHWMVADRHECIVLEPTKDGLICYDNPIGIMTNAPEFSYHMTRLTDYQNLSPLPPVNTFAHGADLTPYSGAMGAVGLPGDWSSASRFVRAAFVKLNSPALPSEAENVIQFFRILQSVAMPMGSIQIEPGLHDITRYSCCCNTQTGRYYYATYFSAQISCVDMHSADLNASALVSYPLQDNTAFFTINQG